MTDKLLHESLDKLALQFETPHPQFFKDWFNARVIIDNAATRPGEPNFRNWRRILIIFGVRV